MSAAISQSTAKLPLPPDTCRPRLWVEGGSALHLASLERADDLALRAVGIEPLHVVGRGPTATFPFHRLGRAQLVEHGANGSALLGLGKAPAFTLLTPGRVCRRGARPLARQAGAWRVANSRAHVLARCNRAA